MCYIFLYWILLSLSYLKIIYTDKFSNYDLFTSVFIKFAHIFIIPIGWSFRTFIFISEQFY